MTARQQHGFDYQNYVIDLLQLKPGEGYTDEDDAYCIENNNDIYPTHIKFIKEGSPIELGDYRRNKNKNKSFALIVGFWKGIKGNIVKEHILYPPIDWWRWLFLTDEDFDRDLYTFLKGISNDASDDGLWTTECKKFKTRWNDFWPQIRSDFENKYDMECPGRLIQPRFKRDHKKQKRIQCAIPNDVFHKYFLKY